MLPEASKRVKSFFHEGQATAPANYTWTSGNMLRRKPGVVNYIHFASSRAVTCCKPTFASQYQNTESIHLKGQVKARP